ncbi:MAG: DUF4124 domain-containing protein [Betaproteobacteria bacterium]|nr:MAG: DUF4124 domain-containing protein [Betaproteobacteria bacterium]
MRTRILVVIPALMIIGTVMVTVTSAEIYRHVDKNGQVTYTNTRMKGAKKVHLDRTLAKAKMATPKNFPRVDSKVQRKRDLKRRDILEDELATEKKLLSNAKQTLKRNDALLHKRNIIALKKELMNL